VAQSDGEETVEEIDEEVVEVPVVLDEDSMAESLSVEPDAEVAGAVEALDAMDSVDSVDSVEEVETVEEISAPPPSPPPRVAPPASPPSTPLPRTPTSPAALPRTPTSPAIAPPAPVPEPVTATALETAIKHAATAHEAEGLALRIAFYEAELAAAPAGDEGRPVAALNQYEIGEILEEKGDEASAVKAYAKSLQSDPTLKPNLFAIRRVFEERKLWPNLLKLLDAEIRFAHSEAERAELLVEKGLLLEDQVGDRAAAIDSFEKAAAAAPESVPAWAALEKIFARGDSQNLGELARVLRGLAEATPEAGRKAALFLELGKMQESIGGTVDDALGWMRRAFEVGHQPERFLDEIERIADAAGRHEDVLWTLESRIALLDLAKADKAGDVPSLQRLDTRDRVIALRRRQMQVARDGLSDLARAFAYLEQAAHLVSDELILLLDGIDLAEPLGRWDDLAAMLARRAANAPATARTAIDLDRADSLRQAGRVVEADAVEAEISAAMPQHLGLLVARERRAMHAQDGVQLAQLYVAETEIAVAANDSIWAATASTQAGLLAERIGAQPEAEAAFVRALQLVPGFRPAADALDRFYSRVGKPADQAQLLERELDRAGDQPARVEYLLDRLVAVRSERLADLAGAAQAQRRLCERRPDDLALRLRLLELLRGSERWAELAEELGRLADGASSDERRAELLVEQAEVFERQLSDEPHALAAYKAVLAVAPSDPRASEAFERLSRRRTQSSPSETSPAVWDDLAAALRREADSSMHPERTGSVLLKLAEIHEVERRRPDDAAQVYRDVLDRTPGSPVALRGLERAYRGLGDDANRAEVMEAEAQTLSDVGSRAGALVTLGELYEDRLHDDDHADEAYARALALADETEAPSAVLTAAAAHASVGQLRTAVRRKQAGPIGNALARIATLAPAAAPALGEEHAWLLRLSGEPTDALARLEPLLSDGANASVGVRLQELRLQAARGPEALSASLEGLAQAVSDPAVRGALLFRSGILAEAQGRRAEADRRLRQAQLSQPSDGAIAVALAELGGDTTVLKDRVRLSRGVLAVEIRVERARLLAAEGNLVEALDELRLAIGDEPRHLPALELVRRLAKAGGDEELFARASVRLALELQEAERAAMLYAEAATAFTERGLLREAAGAHRSVLDHTPLDGAAFTRAKALLAELDDKSALVELFTHRLASADDVQDRIKLFLDRAEVLRAAGDIDAAEADLRAVVDLEPDHSQAVWRLASLLGSHAAGRVEALRLLEHYLDLERGTPERKMARRKMAELEEQPGGRVDSAISHLDAVIELAATPAEAAPDREHQVGLLLRQRQWQRAIDELNRLGDLAADGVTRAKIEIRIAQISGDGLRDPRAAVESLQRALKLSPLDLEAMERMVQAAEAGHVVALDLDDKLDRAIELGRQRVLDNPSDAAGFAVLARLLGWRGDEDARTVVVQGQALTAGQEPIVRDDVIAPTKELTATGWERVLPETARSVALDIWRALADVWPKLLGPTPESLGLGRNERVNGGKMLPPQWTHVDKIARSLGCVYELYASRDVDQCVAAGTALIVGGGFGEKLSPARRFRAARTLTLVRERLGPVELLSGDDLAALFAAAARVAELPVPHSVRSAPDVKVEERLRALGKLVGRKEKKALQNIGPRFAELPAPALWRAAVLDGAARVGLVIGGDLGAAMSELKLDARQPGLGRDLVLFAMTQDFLSLRRELGLRI